MTTLPLIGWLLYIAYVVWFNYFKVEDRHKKPVYLNTNWARFIAGSIALISMTVKDDFDPLGNPLTILAAWPAIVFIISSFYLFFDLGLNKARGKKWDYRGTNSGYLDKAKKWLYYSLKILCAIALPISTIILLR